MGILPLRIGSVRVSSLMRRYIAASICAAACALVCAPVCVAATPLTPGYGYIGTFGFAGTGPGGLTDPGHIAVESSTGNILVADADGGRVEVFSPDAAPNFGNYLTEFGAAEVSHPVGIAIDQSNGDVYVAGTDATTPKIARFVSDGAPVPTYTYDPTFVSPLAGSGPGQVGGLGADFNVALAVDPSNHQLLVADRANARVSRYTTSGGWVAPSIDGSGTPGGAFTNVLDVAASASSTYVLDSRGDTDFGSATSRVVSFDDGGVYQGTVDTPDAPVRIAVDPNVGDRLVSVHADVRGGVGTVSVYVGGQLAAETDMPAASAQSEVTGVAIDGGTSKRLYVLTGQYFGAFGVSGVHTFAQGPAVRIDSAVAADPRNAHLAGTIGPVGSPSVAHFEYKLTGTAWPGVATSDEPVGDGSGTPGNPATATVAIDATDLRPNSTYDVRLVGTDAQTVIPSVAVVLHTPISAPGVTMTRSSDETATSASLSGQIDAYGLQTTYHFEYGPTTSYGFRVPVSAEGVAGESFSTRNVSKGVSGLQPGAAYHFRLVATNAAGTTFGPDQVLTTLGLDAPTRAFEMVSPAEGKAGVPVDVFYLGLRARDDGNAVVYSPEKANYSDAQAAVYAPKVLADRSSTEWTSQPLDPPTVNQDWQLFFGTLAVSNDLGHALVVSRHKLTSDAVEGNGNLYMKDVVADQYALIASSSNPDFYKFLTSTTGAATFIGGSSDLSTVVFAVPISLLPDTTNAMTTYSWSQASGLQLVSRNPDGTPITADSAPADQFLRDPNQVSTDGRRIFFGVPSEGLFLRQDGTTTVPISVSQRPGDPTTPVPAGFAGASPDGRYVMFTAVDPLTTDAVADGRTKAYRYDVDTGELRLVSDSAQNPLVSRPATGEMFYISDGALFYDDDGNVRQIVNGIEQVPPAGFQLSPNGRYFVISSDMQLTSFANAGQREVYMYDTVTDTFDCPSCRQDGEAPTGGAQTGQRADSSFMRYSARAIHDDGTLYFDSPDPLVADDVNGRRDVYAYRAGHLSLISPGRQAYDASFADATPDGSNVYLITDQPLVGQDQDDIADLYDARVGGGLAQQSPPTGPAPCGGSECREPTTGPSTSDPAATQLTSGGRNPTVTRTAKAKISIVRSSFTSKAAHIIVEVSSRGRIRASGRAIRATTRTSTKSSTYTLIVPLTQKTRSARRAHRRVRVTISVSLTPPFGQAVTAKLNRTLGK